MFCLCLGFSWNDTSNSGTEETLKLCVNWELQVLVPVIDRQKHPQKDRKTERLNSYHERLRVRRTMTNAGPSPPCLRPWWTKFSVSNKFQTSRRRRIQGVIPLSFSPLCLTTEVTPHKIDHRSGEFAVSGTLHRLLLLVGVADGLLALLLVLTLTLPVPHDLLQEGGHLPRDGAIRLPLLRLRRRRRRRRRLKEPHDGEVQYERTE